MEITVSSQVETFEEAKELLADLEALNEKHEINVTITICHPVKTEGFCELI